ncbi:MAG: helix-turn-helix domain-containing protein [Burkholderiaceae bacterium]
MLDFEEKLLRLKQQIGLVEDQDVATLLGLGKAAFSARKVRDSFPEDKLFSLKAQRPDLEIDVAYVLTGERQSGHARKRTDHVAAFAGKHGNEETNKLLLSAIKIGAEQDRLRKPQYQRLRDLAGHCDDSRLQLLVLTAETFAQASAAASINEASKKPG